MSSDPPRLDFKYPRRVPIVRDSLVPLSSPAVAFPRPSCVDVGSKRDADTASKRTAALLIQSAFRSSAPRQAQKLLEGTDSTVKPLVTFKNAPVIAPHRNRKASARVTRFPRPAKGIDVGMKEDMLDLHRHAAASEIQRVYRAQQASSASALSASPPFSSLKPLVVGPDRSSIVRAPHPQPVFPSVDRQKVYVGAQEDSQQLRRQLAAMQIQACVRSHSVRAPIRPPPSSFKHRLVGAPYRASFATAPPHRLYLFPPVDRQSVDVGAEGDSQQLKRQAAALDIQRVYRARQQNRGMLPPVKPPPRSLKYPVSGCERSTIVSLADHSAALPVVAGVLIGGEADAQDLRRHCAAAIIQQRYRGHLVRRKGGLPPISQAVPDANSQVDYDVFEEDEEEEQQRPQVHTPEFFFRPQRFSVLSFFIL